MHDQYVFEKGDIVYTAALRSIGRIGSERYVPVLFTCLVKCARRDHSLDIEVVEATFNGEKLDSVPPVSRDRYPEAYLFYRTPYEAMTRLRASQETYVESIRTKLIKYEALLKLVNADPLLNRNPRRTDDSRPANQPGDDVLLGILKGEACPTCGGERIRRPFQVCPNDEFHGGE